MPDNTDHQAIRKFMEHAAAGQDTGRKMKYDPVKKKFVVVDAADDKADELPEVTPEDLQSFAVTIVLHEGALPDPGDNPVPVALEAFDDGDLWRIGGLGEGALLVKPGKKLPSGRALSGVRAVVIASENPTVRIVSKGKLGAPVEPIRVPRDVDIFHRTRGVLETDALAKKTVAIVGVGSGGSFIARELSKAGVGRFILIDHDRLEPGNVCRHECGLSDVGRLKVHAVSQLIREKNPLARVTAIPERVSGEARAEIKEALAPADLVIVATDNRESRMLLNRILVEQDVPGLFAAVFRRAYGGQVLRVIPGLTPCYQCFVDALPTAVEDQEVSSADTAAAIAYSDRPVPIEPGLSSDILPVALQVVKLAILGLVGPTSTLVPLRDELVSPLFLWVNRREPGTDYADLVPFRNNVDGMSVLRWYGVYLPRNAACPACGQFGGDVAVDPADLDTFAEPTGSADVASTPPASQPASPSEPSEARQATDERPSV